MRVLMTDRVLFDKNRQPIRFGRMLVESLFSEGSVVILSYDPEQTEIDLALHNIVSNDLSVYPAYQEHSDQENVSKARSHARFDCFIDSDPALITWAYSQGINCLLAMEPKFMDPRFRPDSGGVVSWAHLVDEMDAQVRLLADKRRSWESSGFNTWE